jgi:hypothetical protein
MLTSYDANHKQLYLVDAMTRVVGGWPIEGKSNRQVED